MQAGDGFEPIPVIDLMGGQVVRARAGERASYRPLEASRIATGSEPEAVVEALLALHPFRTLYVADLDAIAGRPGHARPILALERRSLDLELWVDAGLADAGQCASFLSVMAGSLVLGSESQSDRGLLEALAGEPRIVLSLDSRAGARLDPAGLEAVPELWPERLIAMTLARVGMAAGPDLERVSELLLTAPGRRVYAAGGVRDGRDLHSLADIGAAGVLLASALHDGAVGGDELALWPVRPRARRVALPVALEPMVAFTVELPGADLAALDLLSVQSGQSRAEIVRAAVREHLARQAPLGQPEERITTQPGLDPGEGTPPEHNPWLPQEA